MGFKYGFEVFLSSSFSYFKGKFYEKTKGTAIGSCFSPIVANIFMEHFETLALNSFSLKPKCWFQFVDDTFVIWPHRHTSLDNFHNHLNSISPHIKFTMEIQQGDSIPFLDFLFTLQQGGSLSYQLYEKITTPIATSMPTPITTLLKNLLFSNFDHLSSSNL